MTRGWGGGEKASVAAEWGWGDEGTDEAGQTLQQGGGEGRSVWWEGAGTPAGKVPLLVPSPLG